MPVYYENNIEVPRLMILRGAPGVGKSTISKSINKINSANKRTYISVDAIQHLDLRNPSKSKEQLGIKNAALLVGSFLSEGFDVVLDYVFDNTEDIDITLDVIRKFNVDFFLQIFYLDAPIECVVKRNQSRSGKRGEYMNTALLRKLYVKVSNTKGVIPSEKVMNTYGLSAKQTARTIVSDPRGFLNGNEEKIMILSDKDSARALEKDDGE